MWLAEAIPPVGPVFVPALAALFTLAALFFAIGMIKLVDKVARAFFGTVGGAVGWIPFAGKIVKHSLHKIEQKISHLLGSAERTLDGYVALTWHNLARLVTLIGHEIAGAAETTWHLAQQAKAFVRGREMHQSIRGAVTPVKAQQSVMRQDLHNLASEQAATHTAVAHNVIPRIKVIEHTYTDVITVELPAIRAGARTAEDIARDTYKWLRKYKYPLLTGVFTGAAAWALTRLGGGWIRCKNWRAIGKHVCRWPYSLIEGLLGLGLAFAVVIDPRKTAELAVAAEDAMESIIRKIAD